MPGAVTGVAARDFAVLLPPGWARIPLDGHEAALAARLAAAKVADLPPAGREQSRQLLTRSLRDTMRQAREAGGIDILVSLAQSHGVPIAASCLVTYLERHGDRVPLEALLAELAAKGGEVSAAEVGGAAAVRRRWSVAVPEPTQHDGSQPVSSAVTMVDYFLPVPGRPGLLALSFAAPIEPLADALVLLFDAIAASLRWVP